jgi:hypothetical protein
MIIVSIFGNYYIVNNFHIGGYLSGTIMLITSALSGMIDLLPAVGYTIPLGPILKFDITADVGGFVSFSTTTTFGLSFGGIGTFIFPIFENTNIGTGVNFTASLLSGHFYFQLLVFFQFCIYF